MSNAAFLIYVDLDSVPETFHTPLSAYQSIQGILNQSAIRPYVPFVALASTTIPINPETGRKRVSFVVFVNLDPIPGTFHSQESACLAIRHILDQRIPHYNPVVRVAPDHMQPSKIAVSSEAL